jgi:putative oxidoreductase
MANMQRLDLEERAKERLPGRLRREVDRVDAAVSGFMERYGITFLRFAVGIVFIWFGVLKLVGRSPVEDLVRDTVFWLPGDAALIVMGVWEVVVGVGLIIPVALRLILLLFWAQMFGTLLSFVFATDHVLQNNNPLLLTETGEFVVKNLVLISAGLVIGSTVRRRQQAARDALIEPEEPELGPEARREYEHTVRTERRRGPTL